MTGTLAAHPDRRRLIDYSLGKLSDTDSAEVERHVAACRECLEAAAEAPADSFVALLDGQTPSDADVAADAGPAADPSLPGLYKRLAAILAPQPPVAGGPAAAGRFPPELAEHPRYAVLEELGAGGMGTVYKARHRLMDRVVAVKVVRPDLLARPAAGERFLREVQAAARLSHPNIVTAYDAERAGAMHFLVMEYVEGHSLARVLQEKGPLGVAEAVDYVCQAAEGLRHAHSRGLVHRDIKPHNLVLTTGGQVKILDFGLARFLSEARLPGEGTDLGAVLGSPDYMAPEQARDARAADIRADIYGLGCTLFHLLVGQAPFPEGTAVEKITAHLERQPPPLTSLRPDVPAGLAAVVARMLAKDPAERYQTPDELIRALAPFARGDGPGASSPPRPAARRGLRPTGVAAAVAALALAAVAAAVVWPRFFAGAPARPAPAPAETAGNAREAAEPPEPPDSKAGPNDWSSAKPLLDENFRDPKVATVGLARITRSFDSFYQGGRFVVKYKDDMPAFSTYPCLEVDGPVAFQVTARTRGQAGDGWGIYLVSTDATGLGLRLTRDGVLRFEKGLRDGLGLPAPGLKPVTHPRIKEGDEDNTLLVVLRGRTLTCSVNGEQVCEPVALAREIRPVRLLIAARPVSHGATAEFARVTVWPADGMGQGPKR
jgi:tRNA A-37 threonylcarbamoyl transferase component Bud32